MDDYTSAIERIKVLKETAVVLFPNLSEEDKRSLLYIEDEPCNPTGSPEITED